MRLKCSWQTDRQTVCKKYSTVQIATTFIIFRECRRKDLYSLTVDAIFDADSSLNVNIPKTTFTKSNTDAQKSVFHVHLSANFGIIWKLGTGVPQGSTKGPLSMIAPTFAGRLRPVPDTPQTPSTPPFPRCTHPRAHRITTPRSSRSPPRGTQNVSN